jgi:hypothetical protein
VSPSNIAWAFSVSIGRWLDWNHNEMLNNS